MLANLKKVKSKAIFNPPNLIVEVRRKFALTNRLCALFAVPFAADALNVTTEMTQQ